MKNLNKIFRAVPLALFSVLVVAGCSSSPDPGNTFSRSGTQQVHSVEPGVVESVRVVTLESSRRLTASGQGLEIIVRKDSGQTVAIVQEGPIDAFRAGDLVNVTNDGSAVRVSRR